MFNKNLFWILLILFLPQGYSKKITWARGEIESKYLEINPLDFTNRAQCALDSKKPARTVSLIVDSLNLAKASFRLAKDIGQDPRKLTDMAALRYRYSLVELFKIIVEKIRVGDLPLLPSVNDGKLKNYALALKSCRLDEYCNEMDHYIEKVWNSPVKWRGLDNFSDKLHLFPRRKMIKTGEEFKVSCHFLKKHSPINANQDFIRPDEKTLTEMARAHAIKDDYITDCHDFTAQKNPSYALFQIDLLNLNIKAFDKIGFDFWNSVKLYLSWAWRYSKQMEELSYPYEDLLKSVALEESVLIVPNDCKSIIKPSCDNKYLSLQNLRKFTQRKYQDRAKDSDFMSFLPKGPDQDLLDNQAFPVNSNILDSRKFESTESWMKNFRQNLRRTSGVMKRRLLKAVNFLSLVKNNMPPGGIFNQLIKKKDFLKTRYYYLCSEYNVANHEHFSSIKEKLSVLSSLKVLNPALENISGEKLSGFYQYYQSLAQMVNNVCKGLEKNNFWGHDFISPKTGFKAWYMEFVHQEKGREGTLGSLEGEPLLSFARNGEVICHDGIDCSRKVLASMIDLYSISQYAGIYFNDFQKVSSPALLNPYAERTTCKIYDPWWGTKKAIFGIFSDLAFTAITAFNPSPFYMDLDLLPRRVTSFNQLLEEGSIKYDPQFDKKRLLVSLGIDFGMLGVPCTLSISNRGNEAPHFNGRSFFSGITFEACNENTSNSMTVYSAGNITSTGNRSISGCVSCSLNFVDSSLATASTLFQGYGRAGMNLLRGLIRFFKDIRDPLNIPHKFQVDLNHVLETYRRFGEIPKKCIKKLSKGKSCLKRRCEREITAFFQIEFSSSVKEMDLSFNRAKVWFNACKEPIDLKNIGLCGKKLTKDNIVFNGACGLSKDGPFEVI